MKASDPFFSHIQEPLGAEDARSYCARLEARGFEEMAIRKGLSIHFNMPVHEMSAWFNDFPEARLRHLELISEIHPNRTEYSLIVKVAKNLGLSRDAAALWVEAFKQRLAAQD